MVQPSSIIRSKRKTLSITITKNGEVVVKAPLKISDTKIYEFVNSKEKWICEKLASVQKNIAEFDDVIKYDKLLVFGDKYKPIYAYVRKIDIDDYGKILIPRKYATPDKVYRATKNWYKNLAKDFVLQRVNKLAEYARLQPNKVRINDSRGRWGACTQRGEIILNFRVSMLPPKLLDYVIFHELSHLVEMNHSVKFWNVLSSIMPDCLQARREIKKYGFCLSLF